MSLFCSKCERPCKDKKGLTLHENKCNPEKEPILHICSYCSKELCSKHVLEKHLTTCKERIKKDRETQIKEIVSSKDSEVDAYRSQRDQEIEEYKRYKEQELKECMSRRDQHILILEETILSLQKENYLLKKKLAETEIEHKEINKKMIFFAEKAVREEK